MVSPSHVCLSSLNHHQTFFLEALAWLGFALPAEPPLPLDPSITSFALLMRLCNGSKRLGFCSLPYPHGPKKTFGGTRYRAPLISGACSKISFGPERLSRFRGGSSLYVTLRNLTPSLPPFPYRRLQAIAEKRKSTRSRVDRTWRSAVSLETGRVQTMEKWRKPECIIVNSRQRPDSWHLVE